MRLYFVDYFLVLPFSVVCVSPPSRLAIMVLGGAMGASADSGCYWQSAWRRWCAPRQAD